MNRPAFRWGAIVLAALIAMGIFWSPPFLHFRESGWGDWAWFHHMWEAGRIAYLRWHEAPLWDPHHCGGASLWGNPQSQVFAPLYLLFGLPSGTVVGHKLYLIVHALAGWVGMYLLARRVFNLSVGAAAFTATVWCASGFFTWHGTGGHGTYLSFYYGPLVLLAWRAAARDLRYAAAVAALMVLILTEGGHYPFPYFALWLGLDFVIRVFDRQQRRRVVVAAVVSGALTATMGAFRIVPVLLAVTDNPKPVLDTDFLTLREILFMLTRRTVSSFHFKGHIWVWPEYGAFVGWTVLALVAAGLVVAALRLTRPRLFEWASRVPRREVVWILIGLVFFFLLTQGKATDVHPWPLLQKLPVFRSLHLPSRWRVMLIFYLALLAGMALDATVALLGKAFRRIQRPKLRWVLPRVLPALIGLGAMIDIYVINGPIVDHWRGPPIGGRKPEPHFYMVQGRPYYQDFANYPSENVGTERCYDPVPWKVSKALRLGRVPQVIITPPDAGTVVDYGRTSLTMWADVRLTAPATVTFNQNLAPGWTSRQGKVTDDRGLLAIKTAAPFDGRLTTRFLPPDLPYTVTLSGLAAVACVLVARGTRFRRRPRSLPGRQPGDKDIPR